LRSARAWRIGWSLGIVEPLFMLPCDPCDMVEPEEVVPEDMEPDELLFCGVVPVVPIGPPDGFCWPAAVAGFAGAVVGGLPWAKATPAAPTARAAMKLEVRVMLVSLG
jgi:hypothetical protein